jgi:hypothetical protein
VLIELETVPPREPRLGARIARGARGFLERWAGGPAFAFVFGGIFVLLATSDAAEVLEHAIDGPGIRSVSEWIITVTCVVSLVLALIGFAAMASSRVIGYRWFEASILVSILVTQIFLFHEAQIEATIDLTITLAFWMLLRAAMSVERATDLAVPAAL